VPTDAAKQFCEQNKLFFIETSALADSNVTTAFETILKEIHRLISKRHVDGGDGDGDGVGDVNVPFAGGGQSIVLDTSATGEEEKSKCC
jgi:Ras-related protein Rab-11A